MKIDQFIKCTCSLLLYLENPKHIHGAHRQLTEAHWSQFIGRDKDTTTDGHARGSKNGRAEGRIKFGRYPLSMGRRSQAKLRLDFRS